MYLSENTIIIVMLTAVAQGVIQSCADFCKLILYFDHLETPWRGDCNCHQEEQQSMPRTATPTLKIRSSPYDDDGVYYEPVEANALQSISDISQPLLQLLNPAIRFNFKKLPNEITSDKNERHKISPKVSDKFKYHTNYQTPHKLKRRQNIMYEINIKSKELPLYLDIDIQNPMFSERSSKQESLKSKFADLSEKTLMECIDLHINIKKFANFSDTDKLLEINKTCSAPFILLKKSLNEIRNNLPHSKNDKDDSQTLKENITAENPLRTSTTPTEIDENLTLSSYTVTPEPRLNNYNNENNKHMYEHKVSHANDHQEIYSNHSLQDVLKSTHPTRDSVTLSNVEDNKKPLVIKYNTADAEGSSASRNSAEPDTDTVQNSLDALVNDDIETSIPTKYTNEHILHNSNVNHKSAFLTNKTKGIMDNANNTTSLSNTSPLVTTDKTIKGVNDVTIEDISNDSINLNISNLSRKLISSDTDTDRIDNAKQSSYLEKDLQIPKILTKEFLNDTLVSYIDGNEIIPNSDFNNISNKSFILKQNTSSHFTDKCNNNSGILNKTQAFTGLTTKKNVKESQNDTRRNINETEISGFLYFIYEEQQIPARFVQKPDGKINLAIDGYSLCDQFIKHGENKSTLMTTLCNCIRLDNCK